MGTILCYDLPEGETIMKKLFLLTLLTISVQFANATNSCLAIKNGDWNTASI